MVPKPQARKKLTTRLLNLVAPKLVADMRTKAAEMGLELSTSFNIENGKAVLAVSGERLLERQFGSIDEPPQLIVTRLLGNVAHNRRQPR